uniref:Uncharacterized protein n=1 Tax=Chrysotila carterae TaxID=13221 RepID=A0A7S4C1Y6_CHRCT
MVRLRGIGSSQLAHADGRYGQIRYADKALFWGEASLFSGAGGDNEALQRHFDVGMRHVERSVVVHWEAKETLALASRLAELERESQQLQRSSGALTQQLRIDVGGPDARINSSSERPRRRRSEAVFATSGRNEECHGCTSQPEHRSSGGAIESGPQVPEQLEPVQCQEARRQLPAASSESRSRSATQEYPVHGNELGHYQPEEVSEKESLVARDVDTQHEPLLSRVHEALRSHSTPSSELRSLLHSLAIAHGALLKQQRRMEGERSDVAAEILDLTRSLMLEAPRMQRLQREQAVEAAAAKAREAAVEQSRVLVAKAEADVLRAVSASSAASALVPDSVLDGGNSANRAHLDRLAEAVAAGPTASTLVAAGVLAQLQPLSTADRLRLRLQRSSGTVAAAGHRSGRYARACETLLSLASRTPPPPALPELLTALSALLSADEPSALKCVESNALNSLAPLMVSRESDVAAAALGTLTTLCACCGADPVAAAIKRRGPSPQELMRALVAHLGRGSRHLKPAEAAAAMAALVECMPSAAKIAVTSGALEVLLVRLGMQRHGRPSCCGHESAFACDATTFY